MATMKIEIPYKDELSIIRYLLDEIEDERSYNEEYKMAERKARKEAESKTGWWGQYFDYNTYPHEPRKSIINDDLKMIRRLALKIKEDNHY